MCKKQPRTMWTNPAPKNSSKNSVRTFARLSSALVISTLLVGQTVFAAAELVCPNGKRLGTTVSPMGYDFLGVGTNCVSPGNHPDNKGYLDSYSSIPAIGYNSNGTAIKMSCALHSNAPISGITVSTPVAFTGCPNTTANLVNKYVLIKDSDNKYYSVLHTAYNDWNGTGLLVAKQCDPTGTFDSTTGCSGGTTAACTAVSGTIPCSVPTGLTATAVSGTQINLTWSDPSTEETGFKIENSTTGALIATTAANAISYNVTGLTCNTSYSFVVRATNSNGDSAPSNIANATTTACSAPVNAPVNLHFSKQVETTPTEIELK